MVPRIPAAPPAADLDEADLQHLSDRALDRLFRASPAGPIPAGRLRGTALPFPGTPLCRPLAALVHRVAWQGKVTDESQRALTNLVGPFGFRAVRALLTHDRSRVDGEPCVLIDYSTTSTLAARVRDELRLVSPGLYLGLTWLGKRRVGWFGLRQGEP